jgi:phospholipid/cholesterol/gamma-HCH transport system substrate-binding protein
VGAAVKLLGVRVGRIESIAVRSDGVDKVEVEISVEHGTPIRQNAHAVMSGSPITGLMFVELTGGTTDVALVKPGSEIPARPSALSRLTGEASNIAMKTDEVLTRILDITDEQNVANLRQALDNIAAATMRMKSVMEQLDSAAPALATASERLAPLITTIYDAAAAVRSAANVVNSVGGDARKIAGNMEALTRADGAIQGAIDQLRQTLATVNTVLGGDQADQTSREMRAAIKSFTKTMNDLSVVLSASGSDVRRISNSLRAASENLEEFARAIRENPSLLLRATEGED